MENFEKVEKLRARANVSFEEAKAALDACDGDLLDAMVYLEKQGKVKQPDQSTYSTNYEEQKQYASVKDKVKSQEQKKENFFGMLRRVFRKFMDKCRGNYFCVMKNKEVKFKIPVLFFLILLIAFWRIALPVMVVLLFFGCRYSFYGKDDLAQVNKYMDKASDFAEQVKEKFNQEMNETDD